VQLDVARGHSRRYGTQWYHLTVQGNGSVRLAAVKAVADGMSRDGNALTA